MIFKWRPEHDYAKACIQYNIPNTINDTTTNIIDEIFTDIMQGYTGYIKAKQPESGDLCAISPSLGWRKNTLARRAKLICSHPKQSDIAIQYTRRRLFCFYILLFNGFKSFQAEINMYLLLYFIILNHSVGIHPTATQKSHEQHSNAIHGIS